METPEFQVGVVVACSSNRHLYSLQRLRFDPVVVSRQPAIDNSYHTTDATILHGPCDGPWYYWLWHCVVGLGHIYPAILRIPF
jgi:hypothetical protein